MPTSVVLWCIIYTVIWAINHLETDNWATWATANWATHFGQLGDNIGRVIKDVNIGKIFEIISF